MKLIELSLESSSYGYRESAEGRFALNEDEIYLIAENNINTIYSLGIGKMSTKENKIMKGNKFRVVYNNPLTILYVNGKKYISKAHNEEFDEEKGLLMCLAKANGISHLELKRMIKNAERPKKNTKQKG